MNAGRGANAQRAGPCHRYTILRADGEGGRRMRPDGLWTAVIGKADLRLLDWLRQHGLPWTAFADPHEAMLAKNSAIRAFLQSGRPHLLMIDGDQIPVAETAILSDPDC